MESTRRKSLSPLLELPSFPPSWIRRNITSIPNNWGNGKPPASNVQPMELWISTMTNRRFSTLSQRVSSPTKLQSLAELQSPAEFSRRIHAKLAQLTPCTRKLSLRTAEPPGPPGMGPSGPLGDEPPG
jgi:hypothetical protein